jgi:hypothetical protein
MAHPNLKLRSTDNPGETLVIFHGHTIGTVERDVSPRSGIVRWYPMATDQTLGHGRRLRKMAVSRVLHEYMARTGSCSARHNVYIAAVAARLEREGSTK